MRGGQRSAVEQKIRHRGSRFGLLVVAADRTTFGADIQWSSRRRHVDTWRLNCGAAAATRVPTCGPHRVAARCRWAAGTSIEGGVDGVQYL